MALWCYDSEGNSSQSKGVPYTKKAGPQAGFTLHPNSQLHTRFERARLSLRRNNHTSVRP